MSRINERLDNLGLGDNIGAIDGIAVAILTYMLSPQQSKIRNTFSKKNRKMQR